MTLRGRYQYRDIDMMKCRRLLFRRRPHNGCDRQRIQPTIRFAAALFALIATATYVSAQGSERAPNEFERAYTVIALDMDSAELCGKISPNAVSRAPFNSPGTRVVGERSRCYFQVALKTLNPHHCRNVRQVGSRRQGGHFSSANCQQLIAEGKRFNVNFSFNHKLVLEAAGYSDADVAARFPRHPQEDSWSSFYHSFFRRSDGGFQHRLPRLPDFSEN